MNKIGRIILLSVGMAATFCFGGDGGQKSSASTAGSYADPVSDEMILSARLLRERILADPYRPRYHFCVPEDMGNPGDPNGAFYHDGRYHLMYLYDRRGTGFC